MAVALSSFRPDCGPTAVPSASGTCPRKPAMERPFDLRVDFFQACVHRGSVAAILKAPCTSGGTIVQDPSGSGGAVDCFHGYYRISAHGRGYVSGPATVNGAPSPFTHPRR